VIATISTPSRSPTFEELAFTALMLALYRLGSHIPVPGVDTQAVKSIQNSLSGNNILGFLNCSRRRPAAVALMALGIMPYITASIIPCSC